MKEGKTWEKGEKKVTRMSLERIGETNKQDRGIRAENAFPPFIHNTVGTLLMDALPNTDTLDGIREGHAAQRKRRMACASACVRQGPKRLHHKVSR